MVTRQKIDKDISLFKLVNEAGNTVVLTDFGASVRSIIVPDRDGKPTDVALAPAIDDIRLNPPYFGAVCGRVANRISGASFKLGGKTYNVTPTHGDYMLHGGKPGYSHRVWNAEITGDDSVAFSLFSPDGEQGFPGNVNVTATYTWSGNNSLSAAYTAETDAPTILNLTNHTYFNLDGHDSGDILDHSLTLFCDFYLPCDASVTPTGEILDVSGTVMDFTLPTRIGERIDDLSLKNAGGYDHSFVMRGGSMRAAAVKSAKSGIILNASTDYPAVHFYSGCNLHPCFGKDGSTYDKFGGFCLETQYYPNFINVPEFENHILEPNQIYRHKTVYAFTVQS